MLSDYNQGCCPKPVGRNLKDIQNILILFGTKKISKHQKQDTQDTERQQLAPSYHIIILQMNATLNSLQSMVSYLCSVSSCSKFLAGPPQRDIHHTAKSIFFVTFIFPSFIFGLWLQHLWQVEKRDLAYFLLSDIE